MNDSPKPIVIIVDDSTTNLHALFEVLYEIQVLNGALRISCHCIRFRLKIRAKKGTWTQMEPCISRHSEVTFCLAICPVCAKEHYSELGLTGINRSDDGSS